MTTASFSESILQGIPSQLPAPKPYNTEVNHAPKRKNILTPNEKKLALRNALRYFPELIVMETGGMKGRRAELSREELHRLLKPAFGVNSIHSEYGMTELLSQAYSHGNDLFR